VVKLQARRSDTPLNPAPARRARRQDIDIGVAAGWGDIKETWRTWGHRG